MRNLRKARLTAAALSLSAVLVPLGALAGGEPAAGGASDRPARISPPKRLEVPTTPGGPAGAAINVAAVPRAVRQSVVADAARRFAVAESAVVVVDAEQVTWPDGSLGCPQPGMMYTQALVPGYRLTAKTTEGSLRYHTDARGNVVTCAFVPRSSRAKAKAGGGAVKPGTPATPADAPESSEPVAPRTAPPGASAPDR